ncbi:hypothetical protein [Dactylosporangium sp. CA-139066]|uniref:hypothetical protein n=1 Tax=Dactylosporangium sp. CA-139066 TaxID=3239930 RepID=UPI003D941342
MTAEYRNRQADTFDHEPDHGLLDPGVRAAWRTVLPLIRAPPLVGAPPLIRAPSG